MPRTLRAYLCACALAIATQADAAEPKSFVEGRYKAMIELLRRPPSSERDAELDRLMDALIDQDELLRRSFGEPCPKGIRCVNHWESLKQPQRDELSSLVRELVHRTFKSGLERALERDTRFTSVTKGERELVIHTESTTKNKPRDPALRVDFVVREGGGGFRLVDIVTEGSTMTKNYYEQFHKMMITDGQGYAYVVKKLRERIGRA